MKEEEIYSELSSIRNLMERSTRFISLSGLSGVLAGLYALVGAFVAYRMVYRPGSGLRLRDFYVNDPLILWPLFGIALAVLVLSISTCVWLTIKQAKRKQENFWNPVSRKLLANLSIPLITGGLFILVLIARGEYDIIAPVSLIFYGLALVSGSHYTYSDVKFLGFLEIAFGLLAALMPGFGLIFWVIGFGFLHILYGAIMHFKYDK